MAISGLRSYLAAEKTSKTAVPNDICRILAAKPTFETRVQQKKLTPCLPQRGGHISHHVEDYTMLWSISKNIIL